MTAQQVLVCFDYEGHSGMPFRAAYDIYASTDRILESLDRHRVHAVFFLVGVIAVAHPDLVSEISSRGHEIAVHGWEHENLKRLSPVQLATFNSRLAEAEAAIEAATGARPTGFRAPHLLGREFFDEALYRLLAARGYRWTSNREVRYPVELLRPDRLRTQLPWRLAAARGRGLARPVGDALLLALNPRLLRASTTPPGRMRSLRWLLGDCPPFEQCGLLEIPLYCPMDCDLLGLPRPSEPTPPGLLEYAQFALRSSLARTRPLSMLTFHDWIISGCGRLALLDSLLEFMAERGAHAVTVQENWPSLASLGPKTS